MTNFSERKADYHARLGLELAKLLETYSDDCQTGYVNPKTDHGDIRLDLGIDPELLGEKISQAFHEVHKTRPV